MSTAPESLVQVFMYVLAEWEGVKHKVNQAVLWSEIARTAPEARVSLTGVQMAYPYAFTEYGGCLAVELRCCALLSLEAHQASLHAGGGLKGLPFNLTLAWETVPYAGLQFRGRTVPTAHEFPAKRIPRPEGAWGRNWI